MTNINLKCRSCRHQEPLPVLRCPDCGAIMDPVQRKRSMSPIIVILLLFFVLGPFALPMLWRNDRFNTATKWVLTVMVVIYTFVALWYVWVFVENLMGQVDQAMGQMQAF